LVVRQAVGRGRGAMQPTQGVRAHPRQEGGMSATVTFELRKRDLVYWTVKKQAWVLPHELRGVRRRVVSRPQPEQEAHTLSAPPTALPATLRQSILLFFGSWSFCSRPLIRLRVSLGSFGIATVDPTSDSLPDLLRRRHAERRSPRRRRLTSRSGSLGPLARRDRRRLLIPLRVCFVSRFVSRFVYRSPLSEVLAVPPAHDANMGLSAA